MHRRWLLAVIGGLALTLGGCGGDDEKEAAGSVGVPIPQPTSGEIRGFPASISHAYGPTDVKRPPERIVTVGRTEHDIVLALGGRPIAVTEWFGNQPSATWPWARKQLGDAKPVVLHTDHGFEFDRVKALDPDLILAINAGLSRSDYERFSKIAPTIGPDMGSSNAFSSSWESQVSMIAAALGRMDMGDAYIADARKRYGSVAAAHHEFAGKTVTFARPAAGGGTEAYPDGVDTEFLSTLGLVVNPKLNTLLDIDAPSDMPPGMWLNAPVVVPAAKSDLLDADVGVVATERPEDVQTLLQRPEFAQLGMVKDGRTIYADPVLSAAMRFSTPLSLRYVLEHLPPLLEDALKGKSPQELQSGDG